MSWFQHEWIGRFLHNIPTDYSKLELTGEPNPVYLALLIRNDQEVQIFGPNKDIRTLISPYGQIIYARVGKQNPK